MNAITLDSRRADQHGMVFGAAATLFLVAWLATRDGASESWLAGPLDVVYVLLTAAPIAILWFLAAAGFGALLRAWLAPNASHPVLFQLALGVAAMLWLDCTLGRLGLLQAANPLSVYALTVIGCAILALQLVQKRAALTRAECRVPWLCWCAAPSFAVCVVAACSAPSWLWSTEFGGYDALSYHLQLPKEWAALGRISPLEHNVYSFLPGSIEAAYYHVMLMHGDPIRASIACQVFHALLGLLSAIAVACLVQSHAGRLAGVIAFVLTIGTGWIVVVGSLAYNELAVVLFLASSVIVLSESGMTPGRRAVLLGLFIGSAITAKLTAVGFVAIPIACAAALQVPLRLWLQLIVITACTMFIILLPWLLDNVLSCGNPVFPFATFIFSSAHWNAEQVQTWHLAHLSDLPIGAKLIEATNQFLRFGWGPNPDPREPWQPQWAMLPAATIFCVVSGCMRPQLRARLLPLLVMLVAQIGFWLLSTHIKSRFMVPAIVPMVAIICIVAVDVLALLRKKWQQPALAFALGLHSLVPMLIVLRERNGAPAAAIAAVDLLRGDVHARLLQQEAPWSPRYADILETAPMSYWVNHTLNEDARVLCIGEAAPFYLKHVTYTTTWDRGPMSRVMREFPDQPDRWQRELSARFTHLLIHPAMLERWERDRWNDPLLTSERVLAFAESHAQQIRADSNSSLRLYALPKP